MYYMLFLFYFIYFYIYIFINNLTNGLYFYFSYLHLQDLLQKNPPPHVNTMKLYF